MSVWNLCTVCSLYSIAQRTAFYLYPVASTSIHELDVRGLQPPSCTAAVSRNPRPLPHSALAPRLYSLSYSIRSHPGSITPFHHHTISGPSPCPSELVHLSHDHSPFDSPIRALRATGVKCSVSTLSGSQPRMTVSVIGWPGSDSSSAQRRSSFCAIGRSPTLVIRSPSSSPPYRRSQGASFSASAGLPVTTSVRSAPLSSRRRLDASRRRVRSSSKLALREGRAFGPYWMIWFTTRRTMSLGIAKPTPTLAP